MDRKKAWGLYTRQDWQRFQLANLCHQWEYTSYQQTHQYLSLYPHISHFFYVAEEKFLPWQTVIWLNLIGEEAEVIYLFSLPSARRQGWASFLWRKMCWFIKKKGAKSLWIDVSQDNKGAKSFYEKMGLSSVGVRKDYYAPGEDAHVWSIHWT